MNSKRIYILGALMLILSATAIARSEEPKFPGLEHDSTYIELKERNRILLEHEDSVQRLIATVRNEFNTLSDSISIDSEAMDRFSSHIIELEERIFEIRQERGDVITKINDIEQEYILKHLYSDQNFEEAEDVHSSDVIDAGLRDLIKNTIFTELLPEADYAELLVAHDEDMSMAQLADDFIKTHNRLNTTVAQYNSAETEEEAAKHHSMFYVLKDKCDSLNLEIEQRWNHVIDTKYYAYGSILERRLRYDLLDNSSAEFSLMLQQCAEEDGYYASDALMHYIIGRPALLKFEADFAQDMDLSAALDSLQAVRNNLQLPDYQLPKVDIKRRLFLDYTPITIGRTNFYNNTNPLPTLKVYEEGTIYRIRLGSFRNKQPMTLFKGVQPLYIAQEEDNGYYTYYTGGFATRSEVDEAILFLKEKGFKQPEACRWRDGEMVNLTAEEKREDKDEDDTPVGHRYIIILECTTIDDEVRASITSTAPDKMISRVGGNFAIGTFTYRAEADLLISTLMEKHPEVTVSIRELDL